MAAASLCNLRTILTFPSISARTSRFLLRPTTFSFSTSSAFTSRAYSTNDKFVFKVSSEYDDTESFGAASKFPRPKAVPWSKELANTVHLIGYISKPVDIIHTKTGTTLASAGLAVRSSAKSQETMQFHLNFWEEMAEIAAEHVKLSDEVYISGRLKFDEVAGQNNNLRTFLQVVVYTLNFIERDSLSSQVDANSISSLQNQVSEVQFSMSGKKRPINVAKTEKLWQAFFVNPTEWWDNRNNKRNPKGPDFKHKDTGEALWINSYGNPSWVKSQLDKLDEIMNLSQKFTKPQQSLSSFEDKDFHLF